MEEVAVRSRVCWGHRGDRGQRRVGSQRGGCQGCLVTRLLHDFHYPQVNLVRADSLAEELLESRGHYPELPVVPLRRADVQDKLELVWVVGQNSGNG